MRLLGEFLEMAECSPYAIPKTMHAIIAAMLIAPSLSAIVTGGLGIMLHLDERVKSKIATRSCLADGEKISFRIGITVF